MNFKNKIISLVMSFIICFGTVSSSFANDKERINNFQPLVVDGGIISAPLVATVVTLGVACGVVINNDDDIVKIVNEFYNYHKENFDNVKAVFDACVVIGANKVVTVGKDFLQFVKEFYDNYFSDDVVKVPTVGGIPVVSYSNDISTQGTLWNNVFSSGIKIKEDVISSKSDFTVGNALFKFSKLQYGNYYYDFYVDGIFIMQHAFNIYGDFYFAVTERPVGGITPLGYEGYQIVVNSGPYCSFALSYPGGFTGTLDTPIDGIYSPGGVLDSDNLGVYVPGNSSDLVGVGGSDVIYDGTLNPPYDLPFGGVVAVPGIGEGTFGDSVSDVPNEGIFSNITDFIVSLVVPSDTFWTDTFNGFRDNFSKNFPMLDMSKFDSLAVGGKPFPNLYAYDSKIVDGDVINSIVDWLRPIIAGFIMICLMFFNYRKIYKLIRNTEPFGGIAPGTSEFSTGLRDSEYRQTVREFRAYMAREGGGK